MKKVGAAVAAVLTVAAMTAGSAFAGEVTGNGKSTPIWTNTDVFDRTTHAARQLRDCAFLGESTSTCCPSRGDRRIQAERTQCLGPGGPGHDAQAGWRSAASRARPGCSATARQR